MKLENMFLKKRVELVKEENTKLDETGVEKKKLSRSPVTERGTLSN